MKKPVPAPWPDVETARAFLGWLIGKQAWSSHYLANVDVAALGEWLVQAELGPTALRRCQIIYPELATYLRTDAISATAENALHYRNLERITGTFGKEQLPTVLLKGAALAPMAYDDISLRTMSDVDLWVRSEHMAKAMRLMHALGFDLLRNEQRPLTLQRISGGEVQFRGLYGELVELHWSPFSGWWYKLTTAIDDAALWARTVPQELFKVNGETDSTLHHDGYVRRLAAEDMLIHVAAHLAVNHQFSIGAWRSLLDMALLVEGQPVDWAVVIERVQQWRLKTALWSVLYHLQALFGLDGLQPVMEQLQPGPLHRRLLLRLISPEVLLAGVDFSYKPGRFVLGFLLVDRLVDRLRLAYRTVWPEQDWLNARYQGKVNHWQHLWRLLRYGDV